MYTTISECEKSVSYCRLYTNCMRLKRLNISLTSFSLEALCVRAYLVQRSMSAVCPAITWCLIKKAKWCILLTKMVPFSELTIE